MGKRGRKAVYVEVNGKKGSKTLADKASKVTLCNSCSVKDCASQKQLKAIMGIEAPVYMCNTFEPVTTEVAEETKE
jgi:hypothetical protein